MTSFSLGSLMAERVSNTLVMTPTEPDPVNAGVGIEINHSTPVPPDMMLGAHLENNTTLTA